jgi:hypothetical protein
VCFALDEDAHALLRAMITGRYGHGAFFSELVRKEAERRAQRPALLKALKAESLAGVGDGDEQT